MSNENVGALKQRVQFLEDKVREQDGMLGRRPCQNDRCTSMTDANAAKTYLLCQLGVMRVLLTQVVELYDAGCIVSACDGHETETALDILAERIRAALAP